jgi:hypothetical protein
MYRLQDAAHAEAGRLLRVLQLWQRKMPAHSAATKLLRVTRVS